MEGWVKDRDGKTLYTLEGHWNKDLKCKNVETSQITEVWKRYPLPPRSEYYYHYTSYALQMNHLYKDLMKKLPMTDSRLRPD